MENTRPQDFYPGDILIFSGRGIVPRIIRSATCSPYSHVGMVANVSFASLTFSRQPRGKAPWSVDDPWFLGWKSKMLLFESTTMAHRPCEILNKTIAGVQSHIPSDSVNVYDGRVWRMRLTPLLTPSESKRLAAGLLEDIGTPYDAVGAVLAGSWLSKRFWFNRRAKDRSTLLCVEYIAKHLRNAVRRDIDINPGQLTPAQFVRKVIKEGVYGKPVRIR